MTLVDETTAAPHFTKIRHELRRRTLRVEAVERLTPAMLRLTLGGEELRDFRSLGFDDHVKLVLSADGSGSDGGEPERRDYTPRRFSPEEGVLVLDFALHDAGPATAWALSARPGDTIVVGGPRGSSAPPLGLRRWLLVGDETALPAIGRFLEEADPDVEVTALVAVTGSAEEQALATRARADLRWVHRPARDAADPAALLEAAAGLDLSPDTFVWIAAEAGVARALRAHFAGARGWRPGWMKAAGYWVHGRPDAHERIG